MTEIWQFSAGSGDRDYTDVCLRYGVMLLGPGAMGSLKESPDSYFGLDEWSFLRPFFEDIQEGDLVALKRPAPGTSRFHVYAVGEVESAYGWSPVFSDVDGWDLQHYRLVKWRQLPEPVVVPGLTRGTLKRVGTGNAARLALSELHARGTPLPRQSLPKPEDPMTPEELIRLLINKGLPVQQAEDIEAALRRLQRLAGWYHDESSSVSEHEIRTFLVVPLLRALGWSEQRTKIELHVGGGDRGKMDIALFDAPYRKGDAPEIIVETKTLWSGLLNVDKQAERYARGFPSCRAFVTTDGLRYVLYEFTEDEAVVTASANLLGLRARDPVRPNLGGASTLLLRLLAPQSPLAG